MKKLAVLFLTLPLIFSGTSCIKDTGCNDKTIQSESGAIAAYATANGINGVTHSSGVYYEIITAGTGPNAQLGSNVKVHYVGKFLDGVIFDQTNPGVPAEFMVGNTIPGWQIAIQQLKEGGKMKVIIPSSLAYGCAGRAGVPSNAILYFEIELIDIL